MATYQRIIEVEDCEPTIWQEDAPKYTPPPQDPQPGFKVWYSPYTTCTICLANIDAGEIPIDQEFPSGDMTVPAHNHCHCFVITTTSDGQTHSHNSDPNYYDSTEITTS